jgi:hypothetical protein
LLSLEDVIILPSFTELLENASYCINQIFQEKTFLCEGVSYHGSLLPAEVSVAPSDEYNVCGYGNSQTFCLHLQLFIRKKGPSGGEEHVQSKLKLLDHGLPGEQEALTLSQT